MCVRVAGKRKSAIFLRKSLRLPQDFLYRTLVCSLRRGKEAGKCIPFPCYSWEKRKRRSPDGI
jgi:hypothetical protein